jgi:RNA polymerase sigma-70 factor (ECF subfamily)
VIDERDLISRCREGDEAAYRELFDRYHRRALGVARSIVGKHDAAMDVVQQSFIEVFKHLGEFDLSRNFYTWLYQIVVNRSIDSMRRTARRRAMNLDGLDRASEEDGPSVVADRLELKDRVRACLDQLPEIYRTALMLRDLEGLNCEEMAQILKCSNGAARWRVHHARKLFKSAWQFIESPADLRGSLLRR